MVANVHGLYQKYCKLNNSKKVFGATSGSGENTELAGDSQTAPPPPPPPHQKSVSVAERRKHHISPYK